MEPAADDARLIADSLSNPIAFAGVFDRHASTLLRYLVRRVGPSDAEGLLGEAFRIAFETRGRFDPSRSDARPWLYGIAANLVMKHHRARARHDRALERLSAVPIDQAAAFDERIVDADANAALAALVVRTIDGLPATDREVLLLYAWQQLSYARDRRGDGDTGRHGPIEAEPSSVEVARTRRPLRERP